MVAASKLASWKAMPQSAILSEHFSVCRVRGTLDGHLAAGIGATG